MTTPLEALRLMRGLFSYDDALHNRIVSHWTEQQLRAALAAADAALAQAEAHPAPTAAPASTGGMAPIHEVERQRAAARTETLLVGPQPQTGGTGINLSNLADGTAQIAGRTWSGARLAAVSPARFTTRLLQDGSGPPNGSVAVPAGQSSAGAELNSPDRQRAADALASSVAPAVPTTGRSEQAAARTAAISAPLVLDSLLIPPQGACRCVEYEKTMADTDECVCGHLPEQHDDGRQCHGHLGAGSGGGK